MPVDAQLAFSSGLLSQALWGRAELAKYDSGCKVLTNMLVAPEGGAMNRPGTLFVLPLKDQTRKARLIPFKFNAKQAYVLEFSHLTMRIIKDGGYVLEPSKNVTGATKANPGVITSNSHGFSNGDIVSFASVGGMTQLNGRTYTVANVTTNTFTLKDVFGVNVNTTGYGTYTSGGTVSRVATIVSPYAETDLALMKFVQSKDVVTITKLDQIAGTDMEERKLTRTDHHLWTFSVPTFTPTMAAPGTVTAVVTTGTGSTSYTYQVTCVATDTEEESLPTQSNTITNNLTTAGNKNTISWTAVAGASKYNVYKNDNGVYGFIGQAAGAGPTITFVDDNIDADGGDTPPASRNPFSGAGNRPACATYHQQRLVRAGSLNKIQTFEMSQTGLFYNMSVASPAKATDAISWTIDDTEANEIRHMRSWKKDLFLFTSGGVWAAVTNGEPVKLDTLSVERQENWGCSHVPPLLIGSEFLYLQDDDCTIRNIGYSFENDSYIGDELNILARDFFETRAVKEWTFARDPFRIVWCVMDDGKLMGLTYVKGQNMFAWHYHETDGEYESVASVPEGKEYAVYLVVKRTVNGQTMRYVERMATRRFVLESDQYFVDCGGTYNGTATTTVTGVDHLEGKTISILADGGVEPQKVVTNGQFTISHPASKIQYGLPYNADLQPVGVDLSGSAEGMAVRKSVSDVLIRVRRTVTLKAGPNASNLHEFKQSGETQIYGSAPSFNNGVLAMSVTPDWSYDASVFIRQDQPLALHITGILANVQSTPERDGPALPTG